MWWSTWKIQNDSPPQFCLHQLKTLRTNHIVIYLRWERVTLGGKIDLKAMHLVTYPTPQSLLNFRFSLPLTSITAVISQSAPTINSCPNSLFTIVIPVFHSHSSLPVSAGKTLSDSLFPLEGRAPQSPLWSGNGLCPDCLTHLSFGFS